MSSERIYLRPLVLSAGDAPDTALSLAGGPLAFARVEILSRGPDGRRRSLGCWPVQALQDHIADPEPFLSRLTAPRAPVCGLSFEVPRVMGVLNMTPDSFSDGGAFLDPANALERVEAMVGGGADIVDLGGESTRPGAVPVPEQEEWNRIAAAVPAARASAVLSVDTRKASVARRALCDGMIFNDVSALTHDPRSLEVASMVAGRGGAVCLMHAQGDPRTMQDDPCYDDVLLDVYDYLAERIAVAEAAGIPRAALIVDPGIGFGKRMEHNLALMRGLSLFHGLGCPVLLGASRKRFIGTLSAEPEASRRAPGSLAAALWGAGQGAQILRVHDVRETVQALSVWRALAVQAPDLAASTT